MTEPTNEHTCYASISYLDRLAVPTKWFHETLQETIEDIKTLDRLIALVEPLAPDDYHYWMSIINMLSSVASEDSEHGWATEGKKKAKWINMARLELTEATAGSPNGVQDPQQRKPDDHKTAVIDLFKKYLGLEAKKYHSCHVLVIESITKQTSDVDLLRKKHMH